jgi:hypothetical protein
MFLLSALLIVNCSDSGQITDPISNPTIQAETIAETVNFDFPVPTPLEHPCTHEPVALTGLIHMKIHVTDNGSSFHVEMSSNTRNVKGTGMLTGLEYINNDEQTIIMESTKGADNNGFILQSNFMRQGEIRTDPDDDFIFHWNGHFTINAVGVPTAEVSNIYLECK